MNKHYSKLSTHPNVTDSIRIMYCSNDEEVTMYRHSLVTQTLFVGIRSCLEALVCCACSFACVLDMDAPSHSRYTHTATYRMLAGVTEVNLQYICLCFLHINYMTNTYLCCHTYTFSQLQKNFIMQNNVI